MFLNLSQYFPFIISTESGVALEIVKRVLMLRV